MSEVRRLIDQLKSSDIDIREALSCNAAGVGVQQMMQARQMLGDGVGKIGRFEIHQQIGRGGCGSVFRAYDPQLDRWIALKVPLPHLFDDENFQRRFLHEAKDMARISHPNVVPVYEAGETTDSVPTCYIASEYCPGPSLADHLAASETPLESDTIARIAVTLSDALHHVHEANIVHRDIKPSNVLLFPIEPRDDQAFPFQVKLTDFGLAKDLSASDRNSTSNGMVGTTKYMAPEQVLGQREHVGPATDIHGIGVLLYEMLSGTVPFDSDNTFEVCTRIVQDRPPALPPHVPADLARICLKCLEKIPDDRYKSAEQLAIELNNFLNGDRLQFTPTDDASDSELASTRTAVVACLLAAAISVALILITAIGQTTEPKPIIDRDDPGGATNTLAATRSPRDQLIVQRLDELLRNGDDASLAKLEAVAAKNSIQWWRNPDTGAVHGYQLVPYSFPLSWDDATELAAQMTERGMRGKLASIASKAEHKMIGDFLERDDSRQGRYSVWIGLTRRSAKEPWSWISGDPLKFQVWHTPQSVSSDRNSGAYELRQTENGAMTWGWSARNNHDTDVHSMLVEYAPE